MSWSPSRPARVAGHAQVALSLWTLEADDGTVRPVSVPGTVAQAFPSALDADLRTWVFRTELDAAPATPGEVLELVLEGVATSYEVELDDTLLATGRSMHAALRLDVTDLVRPGAALTIRCLPLATALPADKPPRARWRTRLVENGDLRLIRTTLLGRCPGIAPGPPVIGPWRPVRLERLRVVRVSELTLTPTVHQSSGHLEIACRLEGLDGSVDSVTVRCGSVTAELSLAPSPPSAGSHPVLSARGCLVLPDVALWWPSTHGEPALHPVALSVTTSRGTVSVDAGRVGFRTLAQQGDVEVAGLDLLVNGVPVFLRGAVWTPPGLLTGRPESPYATVALARDAGMNLLRVPGIGVYEDDDFFDACDELGVLVWHDLALANLDVPHGLLAPQLRAEVAGLLGRAGGRPSLAVVCGGSETAQQVAMNGLPAGLWRSPFLDEQAPASVAGQALWVANSPIGGDLPFRVGTGIAHWFGVGGYRLPLSDSRTSAVRFAAECLALAHLPDELAVHPDDPAWDSGVPRDNGSSWDFEDVRDHYLQVLRNIDPSVLRKADPNRWVELSRAVSGELSAQVMGELRREGSVTRGAVVLWLRDVLPGTGWGLLDHNGRPKAAWSHLRRALAPQAVWFTDEGLDGLLLHVTNDRPTALSVELRLAVYRADDVRLDEVRVPLAVAAHGSWSGGVEALLGRFVDASCAFGFGPPSHRALVATLEDGTDSPGQAFHFPVDRPDDSLRADVLTVVRDDASVVLTSARLLDGVRVLGAGIASDDAFCLEPGRPRRVTGLSGPLTVTALNLAVPVVVT